MTKASISDLIFLEHYLDFVSRRGRTAELRARAQLLVASIRMLDARMPHWRVELLAALDAEGFSTERLIAVLPETPAECNERELFSNFLNQFLKQGK